MKRYILPFIILGFIAVSCKDKYSEQDNQTALKKFKEIWEENGNSGNRLNNIHLMTDDGVLIRSGQVYSGKEEMSEFLSKQGTENSEGVV